MKKTILLFLLSLLLISCGRRETIDVGMVVSITGNYAPLLVSGRNGALLAVEEINGNSDRIKLNFIVEDDESDSKVIVKKTEELLRKNIDFIIFSTTSGAYQQVEDLINQHDVLAISPTASSNSFKNKDDNLIRTTPDISEYGEALGIYAVSSNKDRIAIVYDTNNITYAQSLFKQFYSVIDGAEYPIERMEIEYNSIESPSFADIGLRIADWSPDAVLIIAGPFDAALICQHMQNVEALKLLAPWSISDELIENGGRAVEGIIAYIIDDLDDNDNEYRKFAETYSERFGKQPSYQSLTNYETVHFLYDMFQSEKSHEPQSIKQAFLKSSGYKGLNVEYIIDQYGDCSNPLVLHTIRNGKIVKLR